MNQKRQQRNRDSRCHSVVSSERHKQSVLGFLLKTIVEPVQTIPRCSKARTLPSISDRPFLPPMAFGVFGLAFRGGHDACGKVFSPTDQLAVGPTNFTIQFMMNGCNNLSWPEKMSRKSFQSLQKQKNLSLDGSGVLEIKGASPRTEHLSPYTSVR
eukprot:CAMPEP_0194070144 /NCGR_PEP_ID=MMETSP0009_2-20130614/88024_1 /TAXON_ID=210454 /ORGANISM="Grammatophora oceanica, Strain CCMP 410" /LENGTH=155 /DNA_ID=CAMNT_0038723397 /DNA_START=195 /DNA_END=662 /DNA_ORIENTATION=+